MEQELADTNESLSDQTCTNQAICGAKMKCEQEMGSMSHDLDEMTAEAHLSEEKAQRAMIDAARLAGNLFTHKRDFKHETISSQMSCGWSRMLQWPWRGTRSFWKLK